MRTLRAALAGTVTLALLGGLGGAVVAQDRDPTAPAAVTGTVTELGKDFSGVVSFPDDTILREGVVFTNRWEASDPRLSGTSTYTDNWREYPSAGFQVEAAARVIENDDGRWVGTATALASPDINTNTDTIVLYGEGAYEGLTAYVLVDWTAVPKAFTAAIFPGEMPPFPQPAAE